jgi:hypothetical protein
MEREGSSPRSQELPLVSLVSRSDSAPYQPSILRPRVMLPACYPSHSLSVPVTSIIVMTLYQHLQQNPQLVRQLNTSQRKDSEVRRDEGSWAMAQCKHTKRLVLRVRSYAHPSITSLHSIPSKPSKSVF